ncbi:MATE family efflux transporter [Bacillus sp. V5-8f]|uniref:MATE family efflux transporter n=1 Tax=Bacillus sp. V5-8f TaxID=2053044 RepID=UPI0021552D0B|nr:MATE family efflux transporter [Bacillus sp. V5-8f]
MLSEVIACAAGLIIVWKVSPFKRKMPPLKRIADPASLKKMMMVNRDLFIRTLCLLTVFNSFTAKGASFGTEVLAANAILLQIHFIMAYFFDGFSNSSSILVGKAIASRDDPLYKKTLMLSCQWAFLSALFIAGCYYLWSNYILLLFTPRPSVIELAHTYQIWLILFPFSAGLGLILYGVFIGATETASIRNSMILALVLYLLSQFFFVPSYHNHGLWLAFILFSLGRSVFLAICIPNLNQKFFPKKSIEHENLKSI